MKGQENKEVIRNICQANKRMIHHMAINGVRWLHHDEMREERKNNANQGSSDGRFPTGVVIGARIHNARFARSQEML